MEFNSADVSIMTSGSAPASCYVLSEEIRAIGHIYKLKYTFSGDISKDLKVSLRDLYIFDLYMNCISNHIELLHFSMMY